MTTVLLTRDLHDAIINISYQLEKANELRAEELELQKLFYEKKYGISL